jgi:hypothetical protein
MPLSSRFIVSVAFPTSWGSIGVHTSNGEVGVSATDLHLNRIQYAANDRAADWGSTNLMRPNLQTSVGVFYLTIPVWQVAVLCLAWPVTCFIVARRKSKRGFPVEPKAVVASSE